MADSITYTYFIQAANGGLVKIGKAKNPKQRLRELQTGSGEPLQLLGVTSDFTEGQLHARFHDLRRQSEWFGVNSDMVEMCAVSGIVSTEGPSSGGSARAGALELHPGVWFNTEQMDEIRGLQGLEYPKRHKTDCGCSDCYGASGFDDLCDLVEEHGPAILGFICEMNDPDGGYRAESGCFAILIQRAALSQKLLAELVNVFWRIDAGGNYLSALSWMPGGAWRDEHLQRRKPDGSLMQRPAA